MSPIKAHYIQTFGKIYTFDGQKLIDELPEWYGGEQTVIENMNQDHSNVFPKYLKDAEYNVENEDDFKLLDFDQYGFHLTGGKGKCFYMNFGQKALTINDLRAQFTVLAKS
jgi:hypothetical protein